MIEPASARLAVSASLFVARIDTANVLKET